MPPHRIARDGLPKYDEPKSARPGLVVVGSPAPALRTGLTSEMPSGQTYSSFVHYASVMTSGHMVRCGKVCL